MIARSALACIELTGDTSTSTSDPKSPKHCVPRNGRGHWSSIEGGSFTCLGSAMAPRTPHQFSLDQRHALPNWRPRGTSPGLAHQACLVEPSASGSGDLVNTPTLNLRGTFAVVKQSNRAHRGPPSPFHHGVIQVIIAASHHHRISHRQNCNVGLSFRARVIAPNW